MTDPHIELPGGGERVVPCTQIKISGIQRSGTTAMTLFLREALAPVGVRGNGPRWKHGPVLGYIKWKKFALLRPEWEAGSYRFILVSKHPYLWYESWLRCRLKTPSFPDANARQAAWSPWHVEACMTFWNSLYAAWVAEILDGEWLGPLSMHVRWEDLIADHVEVAARVAAQFDLKVVPGVALPAGHMRPSRERNPKYTFDRAAALQRRPADVFGARPDLLTAARKVLDPVLVERLGYDL